jgi:hypothetical protein
MRSGWQLPKEYAEVRDLNNYQRTNHETYTSNPGFIPVHSVSGIGAARTGREIKLWPNT